MVKINVYDSVVALLQNDNIFSSFTQNSNKREHTFTGVINDQYFDLSETGAPKASLDKIAKAIAERFGIEGNLTNPTVIEKFGWQLQCWSPVREIYRLGQGLHLKYDSESDGLIKVTCKKQERVEKGAEKPEPVLIDSFASSNYADAEHHLAVKVLRSEEYSQSYVEKIKKRAEEEKEPKLDTLPDYGWSHYEDCSEEEEGELKGSPNIAKILVDFWILVENPFILQNFERIL